MEARFVPMIRGGVYLVMVAVCRGAQQISDFAALRRGVGVIMGMMMLGREMEPDTECPDARCQPTQEDHG